MTTTTSGTLTYTIDTAHSRAHFAIRHLAIAHVRGEFTQVTGTVVYDPADLSTLQVDATIDATSFFSGNPQRDEHVKGDHFLDVAKYPTVTFVSKYATPGATGAEKVTGDLTLHGVTKEVTLTIPEISDEITDPWGNRRLGITATTRIKRSDFGIDFNAPLEGGGFALSDEVAVTLDLQVTRKPE
jgi:polyisoprenoid-binding protein YceI